MWELLGILGEGEAGLCRAWCTGSGLDVEGGATRAGGGKEEEWQHGHHDKTFQSW